MRSQEAMSNQRTVQTDGLAAWIITVACFLIHFIAQGILQTYGLVLPELQEVFGSSRASAGMPLNYLLVL